MECHWWVLLPFFNWLLKPHFSRDRFDLRCRYWWKNWIFQTYRTDSHGLLWFPWMLEATETDVPGTALQAREDCSAKKWWGLDFVEVIMKTTLLLDDLDVYVECSCIYMIIHETFHVLMQVAALLQNTYSLRVWTYPHLEGTSSAYHMDPCIHNRCINTHTYKIQILILTFKTNKVQGALHIIACTFIQNICI